MSHNADVTSGDALPGCLSISLIIAPGVIFRVQFSGSCAITAAGSIEPHPIEPHHQIKPNRFSFVIILFSLNIYLYLFLSSIPGLFIGYSFFILNITLSSLWISEPDPVLLIPAPCRRTSLTLASCIRHGDRRCRAYHLKILRSVSLGICFPGMERSRPPQGMA